MDEDPEETQATIDLVVAPEAAGQRLDAYLASVVPDMSRSRLKTLIEAGRVSIGGATIVEAKKAVNSGDRIHLSLPEPEPAEPEGEDIPLNVVYEDDDLLVIDKPAGLVVHPGAGNWTGTLVNALIAHCGDSLSGIGGVKRPGIVHRLDKDTTGLMVVAKNDRAHRKLSAQFADHGRTGALERGYVALVWGVPSLPYGLVDAPIGRSPTNRQKMAVVKTGGREAVTHYVVEESFGPDASRYASLVSLRLETGRTHQIRVHMAALGHPLLGDQDYGKGFLTKIGTLPEPTQSVVRAFPRQALHAYLLGFEHPSTRETMHFESEPPEDFAMLLDAFKAL